MVYLGTRAWTCPGEIMAPGNAIMDCTKIKQAVKSAGKRQVKMFGEDIMDDQVVKFTQGWTKKVD